jgi:hypothetical protein
LALPLDQNIIRIVWAETARLMPAEGSPPTTKARLEAVVGALTQRDAELGATANYARAAALPEATSPGGDRVEAMRNVVETAIASQQHGDVALPRRAVIWEVNNTGEPRESERRLPKWATWVRDGAAARSSDFTVEGDRSGRVFRLFESDAAPPVEGVAFVSGFTGSGVPAPLAKINYWSVPWVIGILATLLFIWMIIAIGWTGRTATQAHDLMLGTQPEYTADLASAAFAVCAPAPSASPPGTPPPPRAWVAECTGAGAPDKDKVEVASLLPAMQACVTDMGDVARPQLMRTSTFCRLAWRKAMEQANTAKMSNLPWPFGSWFVAISSWFAKASPKTGSISIALPMMVMLLSIVLLMVALGLGKKGRAFGIWISQENRMSLARMQVSLWTIVVLGAFAAMALFNIGMLSEPLRALNILAEFATDATTRERAKAAIDQFTTFPSIPTMILAALGIAVASPMISALIKSRSPKEQSVDLQEGAQTIDKSGIGRFKDPMPDGALEVRQSPMYASLADFFTGERVNDANLIDVSRLQNVVITVILVGGYATLLFGYVRDIAPDVIVRALQDSGAVFPSLPDPGGIFTTLLAASHATYLVSKQAASMQATSTQ